MLGTGQPLVQFKESAVSTGYGYRHTYQICSHYRVNGLRLQNHAAGHGVHQHLVCCDIREVLGNIRSHLIPKHHAVPLGIALGDDCEQLSGPAPSRLECEAHDALDAMAGEHGYFRGYLPGLSTVRTAALAGVLAFAVLADDDPV